MNKRLLGYFDLSFAQFCIALNIILGKNLINEVPIYALLFTRFLLGFIIPAGYASALKLNSTLKDFKSLNRREVFSLFIQALCGGFLFNIFTLLGLQHTSATSAGIVNSGVPALVALFSFLILKERLSIVKFFAILLCVLGIGILSLGDNANTGSNNLLGLFLVFLAIIPEALFTIIAKLFKSHISPLSQGILANFFNAALFLPFALYDGFQFTYEISPYMWVQIVLYALGSVFFFVCWYRGLKQISANTAALFMGIMPVSTTLLAYGILGEVLSLYDVVGMGFVLLSLFLGTYQPKSVLIAENSIS